MIDDVNEPCMTKFGHYCLYARIKYARTEEWKQGLIDQPLPSAKTATQQILNGTENEREKL